MDMHDMANVMRLVQDYERASGLREKADAADALAREVRRLVEYDAELSGRYEELMGRIGEEM